MGLIEKVKQKIIAHSVAKRNKNSQFDALASEMFQLPADAPTTQNNSYYFSAHDSHVSLFVRLGIRGGGEHEVWFAYFNKAENIAFVNSQTSFDEKSCPLKLTCVKPLKEWQIEFHGLLKAVEFDNLIAKGVGEDISASFSGTFLCTEKLYDFTHNSDESVFAQAVAKEKWNKQFFEALKQNTQTHTEQGGKLQASLIVKDKIFKIDCPAMRDHSYGKREWNYMNRHIWLMAVSHSCHLNVSMVSYPALSDLRTGYFLNNGTIDNVVECSSQQQITQSKSVPQEFCYYTKLKSKTKFNNKCRVLAVFPFVMGDNQYTIYEGIAQFDIDDGKTKAFGIAEFGFNTEENRWKK